MKRLRYVLLAAYWISVLTGCDSSDKQTHSGTLRPDPVNSATLRLGAEQRVRELYSYPNNCNVVVCYQDETLSETVKRWLDSSLTRDGFDFQSAIREENGIYYVDIVLSKKSKARNLDDFIRRYEIFLGYGDTAFQLARSFNEEKRWLPNWRFILPHGLAMTNNRSLEVMNFPPVSLVLKTQDYLDSATTHRWMKMLEENGVRPGDKDLYGAILDIVPVAAPANEGIILVDAKIYDGSFNGYAKPMLAMWTEVKGTNDSKPVMTLGKEMQTWFNDNYGTSFEDILDVALVKVTDTRSAPIMFTNHPSKIFYHKENFEETIAIMNQDVIAACWQAQMGMAPGTDPHEMKQRCTTRWTDRKLRKCELVEMQVFDIDEEDATAACKQRIGDSG